MPKTFERKILDEKVVYEPLTSFDLSKKYVKRLFDETLDDIKKDREEYPYFERKYILSAKPESVKILRRAFEDYKRELELEHPNYSLKSAVAGTTGAAISTPIVFYLTKNPLTAIITYCLICLHSIRVGWIVDEYYERKIKGRKEAIKYLSIEEKLEN
jgi:hypothetical protein